MFLLPFFVEPAYSINIIWNLETNGIIIKVVPMHTEEESTDEVIAQGDDRNSRNLL